MSPAEDVSNDVDMANPTENDGVQLLSDLQNGAVSNKAIPKEKETSMSTMNRPVTRSQSGRPIKRRIREDNALDLQPSNDTSSNDSPSISSPPTKKQRISRKRSTAVLEKDATSHMPSSPSQDLSSSSALPSSTTSAPAGTVLNNHNNMDTSDTKMLITAFVGDQISSTPSLVDPGASSTGAPVPLATTTSRVENDASQFTATSTAAADATAAGKAVPSSVPMNQTPSQLQTQQATFFTPPGPTHVPYASAAAQGSGVDDNTLDSGVASPAPGTPLSATSASAPPSTQTQAQTQQQQQQNQAQNQNQKRRLPAERIGTTRVMRATLPVPVPNLTKKSRGRRVPVRVVDPSSPTTTVETNGVIVASDDHPSASPQSGLGAASGSGTGTVTIVNGGTPASGKDLDKRSYVCSVEGCGKCFHRGEHLKRHIRSIHTHEKPFKCTFPSCDKHFNRHDNLLQHIKVHKAAEVNRAVAEEREKARAKARGSTEGSSSVATAANSTTGAAMNGVRNGQDASGDEEDEDEEEITPKGKGKAKAKAKGRAKGRGTGTGAGRSKAGTGKGKSVKSAASATGSGSKGKGRAQSTRKVTSAANAVNDDEDEEEDGDEIDEEEIVTSSPPKGRLGTRSSARVSARVASASARASTRSGAGAKRAVGSKGKAKGRGRGRKRGRADYESDEEEDEDELEEDEEEYEEIEGGEEEDGQGEEDEEDGEYEEEYEDGQGGEVSDEAAVNSLLSLSGRKGRPLQGAPTTIIGPGGENGSGNGHPLHPRHRRSDGEDGGHAHQQHPSAHEIGMGMATGHPGVGAFGFGPNGHHAHYQHHLHNGHAHPMAMTMSSIGSIPSNAPPSSTLSSIPSSVASAVFSPMSSMQRGYMAMSSMSSIGSVEHGHQSQGMGLGPGGAMSPLGGSLGNLASFRSQPNGSGSFGPGGQPFSPGMVMNSFGPGMHVPHGHGMGSMGHVGHGGGSMGDFSTNMHLLSSLRTSSVRESSVRESSVRESSPRERESSVRDERKDLGRGSRGLSEDKEREKMETSNGNEEIEDGDPDADADGDADGDADVDVDVDVEMHIETGPAPTDTNGVKVIVEDGSKVEEVSPLPATKSEEGIASSGLGGDTDSKGTEKEKGGNNAKVNGKDSATAAQAIVEDGK